MRKIRKVLRRKSIYNFDGFFKKRKEVLRFVPYTFISFSIDFIGLIEMKSIFKIKLHGKLTLTCNYIFYNFMRPS